MRHLLLDARYAKVRVAGAVRSCAVLIAIGIWAVDGRRVILGVSVFLSEAEGHWREFLQSLRDCGIGTSRSPAWRQYIVRQFVEKTRCRFRLQCVCVPSQ